MELFIDIETRPCERAEALTELLSPPGNYKKDDAIAKWRAEQLDKAPLDVDRCAITTIAWAEGDSKVWACDVDAHSVSERQLLRGAWGDWQRTTDLAVGYNIGEFDLPILYRRSFLLGVKPSVLWEYRRYQKAPVLDLMQVFYGWQPPYRSLRFVCELCGITPPIGDGADVGAMSPEERIAHCKSDVEATRALYYRGEGWYW